MITTILLPPLNGSSGGVIAFQPDRDRQDEIYIMNADSSSIPKQLTQNAEIDQDRALAWQPYINLVEEAGQQSFLTIHGLMFLD